MAPESMNGTTSSALLGGVELALARISDRAGEGARAFTRVYAGAARQVASHYDKLAALGVELPALAGMPVSIKDLFDVKGEATAAGSMLLADAAPPTRDAEVVRRLRLAGAAIIGKTNMTEFAFSGLGLNPHYGTPLNRWDREQKRIPGGSSSGAAISVTDGMAIAAVGTDTGGSCRIPAALNGIVGMKPSAGTVPKEGLLPLSRTYDSIGPLAATVDVCAQLYSVLSATPPLMRHSSCDGLRLGVVKNFVLEQLDDEVAKAYETSLSRLSCAGARLQEISIPVLDELPQLFEGGGLVAAEAYAWHRDYLLASESRYDPRVSVRIRRGELLSGAKYSSMLDLRQTLISRWRQQTLMFDAILMPTVPMVAPRIADLQNDEEYGRINLLMLRNPTVINALDGCAISIPCHARGEAPVGLTIACANGEDWKLLAMARCIETVLHRAS